MHPSVSSVACQLTATGFSSRMVDMHRVESTSIDSVGYEDGDLYVRFLENRETYVYYDVEEAVYDGLMAAESMGKFVNQRIKPHYRCDKVHQ